ncbi:helix-turn-helix domain-containing protein [Arthrobacter crystallopoietes]|uniref:Protein-tyrosine-phosphatase n=1 Tax=Crystallibacter crystallopoietes TaxID=37928 RepID=A0A1H1G0L7_9MICC|nr:helix-turn-helix domain-containing protein [Arthrobacter crystallopoietes]AUI52832.1 ArsR family transcriptional regulator [Arthrobacter crystallopoietes]SDR06720.1 Protein-tyrosine-phosphatase [Arthrobacter crystallopoietes]
MEIELTDGLERRAALHAALADPARLRIVDTLLVGDASPSELAGLLSMPSNLLTHHLKVLEGAGLVTRSKSEGDRRRSYLQIIRSALDVLQPGAPRPAARVLFVCTANSARSHLAAALWRQASEVPAVSAGTHPAAEIAPGAVAAAGRHHLALPRVRPQRVGDVRCDSDLVVTVCDRAHEEPGLGADLHWSIPDPVRAGTPEAFDRAFEELSRRVETFAPLLAAASTN